MEKISDDPLCFVVKLQGSNKIWILSSGLIKKKSGGNLNLKDLFSILVSI